MAKCRLCNTKMTKKNRSPLKGVCKFSFRGLTPESLYVQTVEVKDIPRAVLRSISNSGPQMTPAQYEREMVWRKNPAGHEPTVEIEDSAENQELLEAVVEKRVKGVNFPTPDNFLFYEPKPPKPVVEPVMVEIEDTKENAADLELLRARKRFGKELTY